VEDYTPNVIEPSFGLGRILYALLEHSYWARESDIARGVLSLPALIAPIKVLIVPISANDSFKPLVQEIGMLQLCVRKRDVDTICSVITSLKAP
jgi:glycyl-tRNA synthetase